MMTGVLGHDLRNPLGAIVSSAEVLRLLAPDDERIQKIASTITSSSTRMRRLIEQLLDFTTARLGTLPVRPSDIDLKELAEHAIGELRAQHPDIGKREIDVGAAGKACGEKDHERTPHDPHAPTARHGSIIDRG